LLGFAVGPALRSGWEGAAYDESVSSAPKLFVNILIFDSDFALLDAVFNQTSGSGSLMSKSYTIKRTGLCFHVLE
jgi:hypothetical protein